MHAQFRLNYPCRWPLVFYKVTFRCTSFLCHRSQSSQICTTSMKHPLKNGRRPTTLVAAASKCQRLLETLGQEAQKEKTGHYRSETKVLLEKVIKDTSGCIGSLKTWTTEIERGHQTSDERIIETVSHYFDKLEEGISAAKDALHHRCHLHLLKLRRSKLVIGPRSTPCI